MLVNLISFFSFYLMGVVKFNLWFKVFSSLNYYPFVIRSFRFIVEFQWFLIALSVLPGSHFAIKAHLFPNLKYNIFLLFVCLNNCPILLFSPSLFLNIGVQVIMPSFSALFAYPSREVFGNICPIFSAMFHY